MPRSRTLGDLRSDLSARLGFGAQGGNVGPLAPILNSILYSSQVLVYEEFNWRYLDTYVDGTIGASQTNVDFPAGMNPERIEGVSVKYSNVWLPFLARGITPEMYTSQDREGVPTFWDINQASGTTQLEFWPQTDTSYTYRVFGTVALGDFYQDGHYTTVDADVVFLHALMTAKAHYKQQDAPIYEGQWARLEANLKNRSRVKHVYRPNSKNAIPIPKPLVVGRDV